MSEQPPDTSLPPVVVDRIYRLTAQRHSSYENGRQTHTPSFRRRPESRGVGLGSTIVSSSKNGLQRTLFLFPHSLSPTLIGERESTSPAPGFRLARRNDDGRDTPIFPLGGARWPAAAWTIAVLALALLASGCGSGGSPEAEARREYERGLELQERGNLPDALEAFGSAIELDPDMPDLYTARGYVYYLYGATSSALADLNRALEINPDSSQAYYYRGLVLASADDPDDAVLNFSKAVQLDPSMTMAYYSRAKVYFEDEEYELALEDLSAAIDTDPDMPGLYMIRGQTYLLAGLPDKAIPDLEQVLALTEDESATAKAKELLSLIR